MTDFDGRSFIAVYDHIEVHPKSMVGDEPTQNFRIYLKLQVTKLNRVWSGIKKMLFIGSGSGTSTSVIHWPNPTDSIVWQIPKKAAWKSDEAAAAARVLRINAL